MPEISTARRTARPRSLSGTSTTTTTAGTAAQGAGHQHLESGRVSLTSSPHTSKDALYVDVAFGLLLRDTERLQKAGRRARTPDAMKRVLARTALTMPSITVVVSALALARGNPTLQPEVEAGLNVLFRQSEQFLVRKLWEQGWTIDQDTDRATKTFWSAVFGAVLISQAGFPGGPSSVDVAATLSIRSTEER